MTSQEILEIEEPLCETFNVHMAYVFAKEEYIRVFGHQWIRNRNLTVGYIPFWYVDRPVLLQGVNFNEVFDI